MRNNFYFKLKYLLLNNYLKNKMLKIIKGIIFYNINVTL